MTTSFEDIEYTIIGDGIPILFVHGGHSNCNDTLSHKGFDPEKFQLITPSRPGYGKTPLNDHRTPEQAANLIIGLLNHLSIDDIIVYGISAGGLTALALAANYPNKVSKLILASAVSKKWLDEKGKTYNRAKKLFNPSVEKLTWGMVRLFSKVSPKMIAKSFYPEFSKNPKHELGNQDITALVSALNIYRSKEGFINDIDQHVDDLTIAKIKCPTLILHSKNDNSVPFEHALHSNKMIENSKLIELNNEWGHLFWIGNDSQAPIEQTITFIEE